MIPKFKVMEYTDRNLVVCFSHIGVDVVDHTNFTTSCIAMEDYELMQSTGLKDAHGTEIYEKDIVRDSYGDVFLIEWLDGSFVLTDFFSGGYDHCDIDDSEAYEIIGNQFEHPHLLEE